MALQLNNPKHFGLKYARIKGTFLEYREMGRNKEEKKEWINTDIGGKMKFAKKFGKGGDWVLL